MDIADLVDNDLADVVRRLAREAAVADAALLSAVVAMADRAPSGFDADEVAFALCWTQGAARSQIAFGRYLTRTLPAVWRAFRAGDLDARRAWVFYDALAAADDDVAAAVTSDLVDGAAGWTTSQLRDRIRRAVLRLDPTGQTTRTRRSEADRRVAVTADDDGTATLFGVRLPAVRACAAYERVDAYARARRSGGDDRTLDQLRADTFLDLLEGVPVDAAPIHRRGVVEIVVPWTVLAGGDAPATLAGYGPIGADIVRQLLVRPEFAPVATAQWRYSIAGTDGALLRHGLLAPPPLAPPPLAPPPLAPPSLALSPHGIAVGPPVEVDPRRRTPGPVLTRWIGTRDRTCRAPGCRAPARVCDVDHTIDFAAGGLTAHDNLALLCRHHHRLKHEVGWEVTQPRPGTITWRASAGTTYTRDPDPPEFG